jgi:hypothetical protein
MNTTRPPEIWQSEPMDEIEYAAAIERHTDDPAHNPFPSLPSTQCDGDVCH